MIDKDHIRWILADMDSVIYRLDKNDEGALYEELAERCRIVNDQLETILSLISKHPPLHDDDARARFKEKEENE